jgi:(4S)-4-hydroxy-5-phosphonooxypentane-2,3-dione isomerase
MHVTLVNVHVKPEHIDAFTVATRANHAGSIREPGNLRFDVLRANSDPSRFILYEVYRDAAAAAAHRETAHYLAWRETVADWLAEPRIGVAYEAVAIGPTVDPGSDAPA